jgi:ABC-2 type transport system permease protein
MTHGIEAARELAAGSSLGDVAPLVRDEVLIGLVFAAIGFALLLWFERQSRHHATLETA